jgi:hypothetical protein
MSSVGSFGYFTEAPAASGIERPLTAHKFINPYRVVAPRSSARPNGTPSSKQQLEHRTVL